MTDVTLHPPPAPLQALLEVLDRMRVQRDLARLCAADLAGRRIGTDGHDRAAAWLRATMDGLGLAAEPFDFTLNLPVLDLPTAPALAILDTNGAARQVLAHRRDFAEHPASADCPQPIAGLVRRWREGVALRGAWVMLEASPPYDTLRALGAQLVEQGAIGLLLPQQPTPEGYLSKRVVAASPIALPLIAVRADLLPDLDGEGVQASLPLRRLSARGQIMLGRADGVDPALADAPLIIGAHYDGVGDDPAGPRLPGAADNAAGVAVALELARWCKQARSTHAGRSCLQPSTARRCRRRGHFSLRSISERRGAGR